MTVSIVYGSPQHPESGITPYRSLIRYTPPAVEPISVADAKTHCRVDISDDDAYIGTLITAAREYIEETLDISMVTQTWEARYDVFPLWELILPRPPMAAGTVTIQYRDEAGVMQTITSASAFQTDRYVTPGRVYPLYNSVWPAVRGDENSVVVRWTAGYGDSGTSCPSILLQSIRLLVAHWYEMRQPVQAGYSQVLPIPHTLETLLAASGWGGYR